MAIVLPNYETEHGIVTNLYISLNQMELLYNEHTSKYNIRYVMKPYLNKQAYQAGKRPLQTPVFSSQQMYVFEIPQNQIAGNLVQKCYIHYKEKLNQESIPSVDD